MHLQLRRSPPTTNLSAPGLDLEVWESTKTRNAMTWNVHLFSTIGTGAYWNDEQPEPLEEHPFAGSPRQAASPEASRDRIWTQCPHERVSDSRETTPAPQQILKSRHPESGPCTKVSSRNKPKRTRVFFFQSSPCVSAKRYLPAYRRTHPRPAEESQMDSDDASRSRGHGPSSSV